MAENVVIQGTVLSGGKNLSVPLKAVDNGDGTYSLDVGATLTVGDVEIGAVEIKNATTDDRASVDTEGVLATRLPNRPGIMVRTVTTDATPDTEGTGPNEPVPDGHAVYIEADAGNTDSIKIGGVGETGAAGQFRTIAPGAAFPVAVKVQNLNQIAHQSPTASQTLRFIVEAVS